MSRADSVEFLASGGRTASRPGLEGRDRIPPAAENGRAITAQPAVEQGRVDAPEVGVEAQVVVEVGQTRMLADDSPLDRRSGHEQA